MNTKKGHPQYTAVAREIVAIVKYNVRRRARAPEVRSAISNKINASSAINAVSKKSISRFMVWSSGISVAEQIVLGFQIRM